jgi:hypothetical protein
MTTETVVVAAPAAPIATSTDRITGETYPIFMGGDPIDNSSTDGDRGDIAIEPGVAPVVAPPDPVIADAAAVAPAPPPVIADGQVVADPAVVEDPAVPAAQRAPIPYDRFREVNTQKNAEKARADGLAAELAALRAAPPAPVAPVAPVVPPPPAYDYVAKETEYGDMLLDGRTKDASALRVEINARLMADATANARQVSQQTTTQTITQDAVKRGIDTAAVAFVAKYPTLDDTSPDYNAAAVADVQLYYSGAIQRGVPPVKAFSDAVNKAAKVHDLVDVTAPPPPPAAPVVPKKNGTAAAAAVAAAQPPATAGVGRSTSDAGESEVDIENLTDAQLAALPPATLSRLRGDTL